MNFLRVNVTFYDAVNMIHDVIRTAYLFPYTAKIIFVGVRKKKSVVVYKKISNLVGRNDNFLAKARKLSILPTLLDIFDMR